MPSNDQPAAICHICKRPLTEDGEWYCSAAHNLVPVESAAQPRDVLALNFRVRFDAPQTEDDALREKDCIIGNLRRLGYDVEPMGLNRRG